MAVRGGGLQSFSTDKIQFSPIYGRGGTSTANPTLIQSKAPSRSVVGSVPGFIAKIEEIEPDFDVQPPRSLHNSQGFFIPPNRRDAYKKRDPPYSHWFRYSNRRFSVVPLHDSVRSQDLVFHSAATIFSQAIKTDHLLCVPFDARTRNVSGYVHDWRGLNFVQEHRSGIGTYYSLGVIGEEETLPESVPQWDKLIPSPYRYQSTDDSGSLIPSHITFAGLIGNLPLLTALAAFSAPRDRLSAALTGSVQAGKWMSHNYGPGRVPQRGLVVTIYLDPQNPNQSTTDILNRLQNGDYGAFYRP